MFTGFEPALIAAGAQIIGGVMTNQAQASQASQAQGFSAAQSKAQMDFQERMRETQYQTAVKDLTAAGLNPMLAYTQGGAGTPSGASAVGQQAQLRNPVEGGASAAAMFGNIQADLALKSSQTEVNKENVKNLSADTAIKLLQDPKIRQETKNLIQEEMRLREATSLLSAQRTYANAQETLTRTNEMIARLGGVPEAKSKGLYYKDYPRGYEIKEISQNAASAASAGKKVSEIVADVVGAAKGGQPQFQPNKGQQQPTPDRPYNPKRGKFGRR